MKRVFSFTTAVIAFLFTCSAIACQNNEPAGNENSNAQQEATAELTTATFPDSVQDFGNVTKGEQVKIVFHVLNTGKNNLLIAGARPSCGCTVADFTKTPIAPGKEGEINATFDSNHGSTGQIRKSITVNTNTLPSAKTLVFTGQVAAAR